MLSGKLGTGAAAAPAEVAQTPRAPRDKAVAAATAVTLVRRDTEVPSSAGARPWRAIVDRDMVVCSRR